MRHLRTLGHHTLLGIVTLVLTATSCVAGGQDPAATLATSPDLIIGVSPFMPASDRPEVERAIARLILEKATVGSRITVYDAYHLKQITDVEIPASRAYDQLKIRSKHVGRNLLQIKRFFDGQPASSARDGRIKFPQFLDFVATSREQGARPIVVLLGRPLYLEKDEEGFAMEEGLVPTDDHLCVDQRRSVYGVTNKSGQLQGVRVHFGALGGPWVSSFQEERVRRFWGLFIERQGGQLISFYAALPKIVERTYQEELQAMLQDELACGTPPKPAMFVPQRSAERSPAPPVNVAAGPRPDLPANSRGRLKVGVRWTCPVCDLDLYSRPAGGAAEVSYAHPKTREGVYFKDFRTSPKPASSFEWIEYSEPVDLDQVEASVNFYHGKSAGGVQGEVQVHFDGFAYQGEFEIPATEGNLGKDKDQRATSRAWTVLDLDAVVRRGSGGPANRQEPPRAPELAKAAPPKPPASASPVAAGRVAVSEGQARGVRILSPKDGERIKAPANRETTGPVGHPVEGDVVGFGKEEIERFGLEVEVVICVPQCFEEGVAIVRDNGTWRLPTASFGGARHRLRATLKDGNGNEVDSHEVTVTVVFE